MSAGNLVTSFPLSGNSPTAQSFFNRLLTPPNATPANPRESLYDNFIDALVNAGTWAKLDCLFVFAAADFMTACVDLVTDRVANWPLGFGVFTADRGVNPQGSSNYLDTTFNPSLGTNFQRNSASCFFQLFGTSSPTNVLGNSSGTLAVTLSVSGGVVNWKMNDHADGGIAGNVASGSSITDGFYLLNRTASNATALYKDGAQVATASSASAAIPNGTVTLATNNNPALSLIGFGGGLTADDIAALYSASQTYLHTVGAV